MGQVRWGRVLPGSAEPTAMLCGWAVCCRSGPSGAPGWGCCIITGYKARGVMRKCEELAAQA